MHARRQHKSGELWKFQPARLFGPLPVSNRHGEYALQFGLHGFLGPVPSVWRTPRLSDLKILIQKYSVRLQTASLISHFVKVARKCLHSREIVTCEGAAIKLSYKWPEGHVVGLLAGLTGEPCSCYFLFQYIVRLVHMFLIGDLLAVLAIDDAL